MVAFEIVLADSRIIKATEDTFSDLFIALKGGTNNFGIVTKFTVKVVNLFSLRVSCVKLTISNDPRLLLAETSGED